jgi:hypothetical protein
VVRRGRNVQSGDGKMADMHHPLTSFIYTMGIISTFFTGLVVLQGANESVCVQL